jgi:hypothetical protein
VTTLHPAGTFAPPRRLKSRLTPWRGTGMNRTRISTPAALLTTGLLVATTPAAAEQALAHWPRQCRGDISRICRDLAKGEDKIILTCLKENEVKLSQACRKLLESYGHVPESAGKRR